MTTGKFPFEGSSDQQNETLTSLYNSIRNDPLKLPLVSNELKDLMTGTPLFKS